LRFIGSKIQLLEKIKEVTDRHAPNAEIFCDIFSGSSAVARYFKQWFQIYSNDLLYFSYCLQMATIENDEYPRFEGLKKVIGMDSPLDYLNGLSDKEMEILPQELRFFQNNYSPKGGRMYITDSNALRIDFARNTIEKWKNNGFLTELEYYYLVACVIEGIPFVSNISGTYGAFHKHWDKRASKKFELFELEVTHNNKNNKCYNQDGVELLKHISGDILYIDPPYNGRQYISNYHVLETAAAYDSPELRGVTGQRPAKNQKSTFCSKATVLESFEMLIANAKFEHIVLSYNTDGIMKIGDIEIIMKKYGISDTFEINYIPHRRFKSRNATITEELKEMLVYIKKVV